MKPYHQFWIILFGVALFTLNTLAAELPDVFVSILPQKYFAEKIAGDVLIIHTMVPMGANPATYEPRPRQMVTLSKSKIYFAIGVPFESAWLDKFKAINPQMRVVHTEAGIKKMNMAASHNNDLHLHHTHAIKDPHIWTSPPLVKKIAKNMVLALSAAWPDHKNQFNINYKIFIDEIDQLDIELSTIFAQNKKNKSFMVFHPAWGYFAQTYGLNQISIEIEGKEPKPAQLTKIIEEAKQLGIQTIFLQPQFSARSANVIAKAINGNVVVADPLAYEWENNLRQQARAFRSVWE